MAKELKDMLPNELLDYARTLKVELLRHDEPVKKDKARMMQLDLYNALKNIKDKHSCSHRDMLRGLKICCLEKFGSFDSPNVKDALEADEFV